MTGGLVAHLARFARDLRAGGVRVATGDEVDALAALLRVDIGDPGDVRWALRCALKIRPRDAAAFEALFARQWHGAAAEAPRQSPPPSSMHGPGKPRAPSLAASTGVADPGSDGIEGDQPGASAEALLRGKTFEQCDERDLAAMEPVLAAMAARLATRRSRRLHPTVGRGRPDLRRSLRRAPATAGELLTLARRARRLERPKLVFLCDTSGSMEMHTRFLLAFARALQRVARTTEVFAFNTELTRVTEHLAAGRQERVLAMLAAAVPDWSGGTRIGDSLEAFVSRHLAEMVDSRTVVIVFSDGLDCGDPALIAGALRRIQARARRVLWLNPLLSDPRYEPTARGMAAALPFVDLLAPAHDLATLERLIPHLSIH